MKGKILRELQVKALAQFIKAVKEDTVTACLEKEFFEREAKLQELKIKSGPFDRVIAKMLPLSPRLLLQ